MRKLITNATVITVDKDFSIFEDGMIAIEKDTISYVGNMNNDLIESFHADKTIDAKGNVVMPGLINAHTHLPMTLFSGYGSGLPLKQWLEDVIWPAEDKLTSHDIYIGSKMGIAQMLLSGTTCFLDMYYFLDDIAKAVNELGIRAVLGKGVLNDGNGVEDRLEKFIELQERYKDYSKIDVVLAPHAIYTNNKEDLKKVIDISKKYKSIINIHVSETSFEVEESKKEHNMSPVEYLESIGMFDLHTTAAHCVHVSDNDIKIMKNKKVNAVHNPTSNMKLSSGIAPIQKMIDAGVNVALGTDGSSSNNNLDMIEEMHIAALIGKIKNDEPTSLDAKTVIKMATINGAKALNLDDKIGSIEKGKLADLIMIDMASVFSQPKREYLNNLVYSIGRNQVIMTMVSGEILQTKGIIYNLDLIKLDEQFNNCVDRLC